MLETVQIVMVYCAMSGGPIGGPSGHRMCVDVYPTLDPPLTEFQECELAGRAGDAHFQATHPGWKLIGWTCGLPTRHLRPT